MIYEIRTYDIRPQRVPAYQERFEAKLAGREEFSPLFGHWYTEIGPLNQIVAIWPYESLASRAETRAAAEASGKWPPDTSDQIVGMTSRIFQPASFMPPPGERDVGPIFDMRIYTYQVEAVPTVLGQWEAAIEKRTRMSPLVGCWYSDGGGVGNYVHMWAYRSLDERMRIRAEARAAKASGPPPGSCRRTGRRTRYCCPRRSPRSGRSPSRATHAVEMRCVRSREPTPGFPPARESRWPCEGHLRGMKMAPLVAPTEA